MRFDHFHGLSPYSRRLIEATVKVQEQVRRVYPDGRSEEFVRDEIPALAKVERLQAIRGQYKRVAGYLHRYTMLDGRVYVEVLQAEEHCGGPHYFTVLTDEAGSVVPRSRWLRRQIKAKFEGR